MNGTSFGFRSSTQKTVTQSVMEAELYAVVITAKDIMYVLHMLGSLGLNAHLYIILEVYNKRSVDLTSILSIGGKHDKLMCNIHSYTN